MKFKRISSNQRGMGTLEMLLILIIIAALGFVGWYVYDANKKANNTYNQASQVASKPAASKTKKAPAAAKTFTFKEFGVKITVSSALDGLAYEAKTVTGANSQTYTALYVTTDSLKKSIAACNTSAVTASDVSFDALNKNNGQYPANPTMDDGTLLKQFDKFYIGHSIPNGLPCVTDQTKNDALLAQQKNLQKALVEAFKTATLVP